MHSVRRRSVSALIVGGTLSGLGILAAVVGYFILEIPALALAGVIVAAFGFLVELHAIGVFGRRRTVRDLTEGSSAAGASGPRTAEGATRGVSTVSVHDPTDPEAYKRL